MQEFYRVSDRTRVWIKRWLAPPVFPDDELKTRRASLLNMALLVTIALTLIVIVGDLLGGRIPIIIIGANIGAVVLFMLLRCWAHHGQVRWASIVLIAFDLIGTTVCSADFGTIRTPTTGFYLLIVVGAGLLFDVTGIIVTTLASSLAILGLIGAENVGWLPQPDYTVTVTQWITYTALIGLAGGLTWMALQATRQALRRADKELAERKSAEEELKASVQYARSMIESSIDMIITTDNARQIVEFNDAAQASFGYTREEILGNHIDRLYARPEDGEAIRQGLLKEGKFIGEALNKRKNGEAFVSSLTASVLRGENGKVLGAVGVSRDITERKRAEEVQRQAEENYRSIFNNAVEGIFQSTPDGRFLSVNPALARMWGYASPEDLISSIRNIAQQVYADSARRSDFQRLMDERGEVHGFEYRARRKDGSSTWVSENARTVRDADGTTLYYEGTIEDIAARKQAEEALRESEARFSGAFEHAAIGMALVSPEGGWLKVNQALCELTGYSESELLGKTFQDITHPDDLETDLGYVRQLLAGEIHAYQLEKRYIHKSGQVVWIQLSGSLVRDAQGNPLHFIAQIQDVSARKRGELDLKQRADEFAALYDNTRDIIKVQDLESLLTTIVERAIHLLNASGGGMYFYDAISKELEVKVATHVSTPVGTRLQMGEGMAGRVAQTRQPLIVDDYGTWVHRSPKYANTTLRAILEVPMLFGGELIGVLVVEEDRETTRKFTDEDTRLLSLFAFQAASAIYNAQLFEKVRQRAEEFSALYDITHDLTLEQDLPSLLQTIIERASRLLGAPGGGIYLYDAKRNDLEMVMPQGQGVSSGIRLKLGEGLAGRVAQTREPIIVDDYSQWEYRSTQYEGVPIRAVVQVPMLYRGDLIGVLAVHDAESTTIKFTSDDARLLALFAGQAASAVYDARLLDETRARARRQEALYHISTSLTYIRKPSELCEVVTRACRDFLVYPYLGIFLIDALTGDRILQAHYGWENASAHWRLGPGEGLSDKAIRTGKLQYWRDVRREPQYVSANAGLRCEVDVPIKAGDSILGVLVVEDAREDAFGEDDFEILQAVANQLAIALENARLYEEQKQLSITDSLTGLYNRRHFVNLAQRELKRAHRMNSPCALLMLDLNDFKRVNDTFGHSAGDEALQLVAQMLAKNVRAIDVVARYGGDEFVMLLPSCQQEEARQIAARLQRVSHNLNFTVRNQSIPLAFSIGIAAASLAPEETLDDLLACADSGMYCAKGKRKRT